MNKPKIVQLLADRQDSRKKRGFAGEFNEPITRDDLNDFVGYLSEKKWLNMGPLGLNEMVNSEVAMSVIGKEQFVREVVETMQGDEVTPIFTATSISAMTMHSNIDAPYDLYRDEMGKLSEYMYQIGNSMTHTLESLNAHLFKDAPLSLSEAKQIPFVVGYMNKAFDLTEMPSKKDCLKLIAKLESSGLEGAAKQARDRVAQAYPEKSIKEDLGRSGHGL
ncbi:hypothetical protein P5704_027290 (plasmid) [Pseudomonas sp. FeN3W]|nr:hypothetical protein P5704_027290 [Pseudomonas sp. FeN3W]